MSRTKQTLAIDDLAPAPYNPRSISDEALHGLDASVGAYGDISGITWNRTTGHLIAGHQRVRVLRERGAVVEADAAGPYIRDPATGEAFRVRVVDWDESKEKAANITANNLAISGMFTADLRVVLDELKVEMPADLFADLRFDALVQMLPALTPRTTRCRTAPDTVPEPLKAPVTQKGDLWLCGGHRILCADSRDKEALARLMDGQKAQLYSTDPPYGVNYDGTSHPLNSKDVRAGKEPGTNSRDWGDEYWDHYNDVGEYRQMLTDVFLAAKEHVVANAAWYCWFAESNILANRAAWEAVGIRYHQTIQWVKPTAILGFCMWNFKNEPCMMGWHQGDRPLINKIDEMTNVWCVDWEGKGRCTDGVHPTQKPIRLFELPMLKHTRLGDVCLETFSGSGSQIVAAESTGRRCYAVERMPGFVDVAVLRWQRFSGKDATLDGDGRSFVEIARERAPEVVAAIEAGPDEDDADGDSGQLG